MLQNIDLHKPDFIIECANLNKPADVSKILLQHNSAKLYTYVLYYYINSNTTVILKIGESCPNPDAKNYSEAERLYRQICHLNGWHDYEEPKTNNGYDFFKNLSSEVKKGRLPAGVLDKDNISIGVWNLESRVNTITVFFNKQREITTWAEGELAQQYKNAHNGELPTLNYRDPTRNSSYVKKHIEMAILDTLFEFN